MGLNTYPDPRVVGAVYRLTGTASPAVSTTTDTAVFTSAPFTVVPSRLYRITAGSFAIQSSAAATVTLRLKYLLGAGTIATTSPDLVYGGAWQATMAAAGYLPYYHVGFLVTGTADSRLQVMVTMATTAGTATFTSASGADQVELVVEDAGAA